MQNKKRYLSSLNLYLIHALHDNQRFGLLHDLPGSLVGPPNRHVLRVISLAEDKHRKTAHTHTHTHTHTKCAQGEGEGESITVDEHL